MTDERVHISQEVRIIPWWAWTLSALVFAGMQVLFLGYAFPHDQNPPSFPIQLVIAVPVSALLSFFVLLIGYVNRDSGRRGMSRALWTLLVIFVPNGIGFILYFLMRHPIASQCPRCGSPVNPRFNFCAACRFELHPVCPQCKAPLRSGDAYCPNCGTAISSETGSGQFRRPINEVADHR